VFFLANLDNPSTFIFSWGFVDNDEEFVDNDEEIFGTTKP